MAHRDGRVGIDQKHRHRLAHDVGAPQHDRGLTFGVDAVLLQHLHDAERRTGNDRFAVHREIADVFRTEAVHVFRSGNALQDPLFVQMFGKGQLHENAVHLFGDAKRVHERLHFFLRAFRGQMIGKGAYPDLFARLDLIADVYLRRGVFPHENDRKADISLFALKRRYFFFEFTAQLCRERLSVNDCAHYRLPR